jgi:hypothetical protein
LTSPRSGKKSFFDGVVTTLIVATITGAVGFLVNILNDFRKSELDFLNAQIGKLYGPLYALTQANEIAWNYFVENQWRQGDESDARFYFIDSKPPSVQQALKWRHWMTTVFQPLNLQIEKVILENSQFTIGNTLPPAFWGAIVQAETYKAVIAGWKDTDFESCSKTIKPSIETCPQLKSISNTAWKINYPANIVQCVSDDYKTLTKRQQKVANFLEFLTVMNVQLLEACH